MSNEKRGCAEEDHVIRPKAPEHLMNVLGLCFWIKYPDSEVCVYQ